MRRITLFTGILLLCCMCVPYASAFEPLKPQSKRYSQPKKKKKVSKTSAKTPDVRALQAQAEADQKHHMNETRYRQFRQMQQAQQRAYQQRLLTQQSVAQSANR